MTKNRVDSLLKIYSQKLTSFRKNHVTAIPCERLKNKELIYTYVTLNVKVLNMQNLEKLNYLDVDI